MRKAKYKNAPVFFNGIGIISPAGDSPDEFFQSLNRSERKNSYFFYNDQEISAQIYNFDSYKSNPENYFLDVCCKAIYAAIDDSGVDLMEEESCVVLGTGMGISDMLLRNLVDGDFMSELSNKIQWRLQNDLGLILKVFIMSNACCASAQAIGFAKDLLNTNQYNYVIAGGIEIFSYLTYSGFKRLNSLDIEGCRPFDRERRGISVGDGAVFFVMSRECMGKTKCFLAGYAVTNDAFHIVRSNVDGMCIGIAIKKAIRRAAIRPSDIKGVIAHGTGTLLNDSVESSVLYQLFGEIDVTAPKGVTGHTGGASGAFGVLTAIYSLKHQCLPPVANLKNIDDSIGIKPVKGKKREKKMEYILVNSIAFGGTNIALVCGKKYDSL